MDKKDHLAFNSLSKEDQIQILFMKAAFLTGLYRKNVAVILFKVEDYFVDVIKCKHTGKVLRAHAFRSVKQLYKYKLDHNSFLRCLVKIDHV